MRFSMSSDDIWSVQVLQVPVQLDPLDPRMVNAEFIEEGDDMLVVYNPEELRLLDVELTDTLWFDRWKHWIGTSTTANIVRV